MKTKHTPEPWTVVDCDHIGATVVSFGDFNGNIELWHHHNSKEESEANAKLIAAAPELLKELNHLVALLEPLEKDGSLDVPGLATLNGARAAIKKATK